MFLSVLIKAALEIPFNLRASNYLFDVHQDTYTRTNTSLNTPQFVLQTELVDHPKWLSS